MFPDKPGGIAIYAWEGWRGRFSLAGPLAVVGYWLTWTMVLAVFGGVIGLLVVHEFFAGGEVETWTWAVPGVGWDVTAARLIGLTAMVAAFLINTRGQRTTVRVGGAAGALIAVPLLVIGVGAFLTGDVGNHPITGNNMAATLDFYGWSTGAWGKFVLVMAWLYVIGYSTYGAGCTATFAPEFQATPRTIPAEPSWRSEASTWSSVSSCPSRSSARSARTRWPKMRPVSSSCPMSSTQSPAPGRGSSSSGSSAPVFSCS